MTRSRETLADRTAIAVMIGGDRSLRMLARLLWLLFILSTVMLAAARMLDDFLLFLVMMSRAVMPNMDPSHHVPQQQGRNRKKAR